MSIEVSYSRSSRVERFVFSAAVDRATKLFESDLVVAVVNVVVLCYVLFCHQLTRNTYRSRRSTLPVRLYLRVSISLARSLAASCECQTTANNDDETDAQQIRAVGQCG